MPTHDICCECSDNAKESNNTLPSTVEECIKTIISMEGYIESNVVSREVITKGGNYLGVLHEVDIIGKTADGDKETNIFVKCVLPGENQMKFMTLHDVYAKELYVYNEIARMFSKIQDDANVPHEERYTFVKCYDGSNSEAILLENLSKKGYTTYQRMDVLPYKFSALAIRELAKFHALSFVVKEKYSDYYEKKIKPIKLTVTPCDDWDKFTQHVFKQSIQYLDCNNKSRVEKGILARVDRYFEYYNDPATKYCLCHGDYKANNILTNGLDEETSKIIPIDFQFLNCGNPLIDFVYLIYGSTDRQFRREHLEDLKNVYFESMATFLQYFDLDIENIYSRKAFEKNYKDNLDYAVVVAAIFLPFLFTSDDAVPNVTTNGSTSFDFQLDACFKERYQGIIDDFIEMGYL